MTTFYGQLDWFFTGGQEIIIFQLHMGNICYGEYLMILNFWALFAGKWARALKTQLGNCYLEIKLLNFHTSTPPPPFIYFTVYGVMLHIHKPKQYVEHSRNEIKSRKIILLLYHNSQSLFQTYVDMRRHMPTENAALLYCGL